MQPEFVCPICLSLAKTGLSNLVKYLGAQAMPLGSEQYSKILPFHMNRKNVLTSLAIDTD